MCEKLVRPECKTLKAFLRPLFFPRDKGSDWWVLSKGIGRSASVFPGPLWQLSAERRKRGQKLDKATAVIPRDRGWRPRPRWSWWVCPEVVSCWKCLEGRANRICWLKECRSMRPGEGSGMTPRCLISATRSGSLAFPEMEILQKGWVWEAWWQVLFGTG